MSGKYDKDLHPSLTDAGLCNVYNGQPMKMMFKPNNRIDELSTYLDPRSEGVGLGQRTFSSDTLRGSVSAEIAFLRISHPSTLSSTF